MRMGIGIGIGFNQGGTGAGVNGPPVAITAGQWTLADSPSVGGDTLTVNLISAPANGGSAITSYEFRRNGGSWSTLPGGTALGARNITVLATTLANIELRAVNALGNAPASDTKSATPTVSSGAEILGNSNTIVSNGETWTLSAAVDWGRTVDGVAWFIQPGGVTVLSRTNAATTDAGFAVNGTMKNPIRDQNGWNERVFGYSGALNQTFPISMAAGDILVGAVHQPAPADIRWGVNQKYFGLIATSAGYPANTWAPALIGWAGRGTPTAYTVDLSAVPASLPSYSLAGITYPTVADVTAKVDRLDLGMAVTNNDAPEGYEAFTTYLMGGALGNYGQNLSFQIHDAALHLIGNVATLAEKQVLFRAMIRHGIQWHDPVIGAANPRRGDGGHHQFAMTPIAMALHYLGRTAALDNLHNTWPGNQLDQPFTYDASIIADLAPHSDLTKPQVSRLRPVVGVTGLVIDVETNRSGLNGDGARMDFNGLWMVRNGAPSQRARALGMSPNDQIGSGLSFRGVTIDAQPTPAFTTSDTIYFESIDPIYEGDTDWRGTIRYNDINPAFDQPYREAQTWSGTVLALRALGIWRSNWASLERYVARANRLGDPSNARDYPTHAPTGTMQGGFWANHAAAIVGSYPVVITNTAISGSGEVGTVLTAVPAVVGPSTGLTRTYQWYNNGVAIGGATATTYTVVAGDLGDTLTVWETITNGSGSQISRSAAVTGIAAYTPNAVAGGASFSLGFASGLSGMPASTQGSFVLTFRKRVSWPSNVDLISALDGSGNLRFRASFNATRKLEVLMYNAAGTLIHFYATPDNEFNIGTYYTVAFSWDTVLQKSIMRKRIDGGSWVALADGTPTLNEQIPALGRFGLLCRSSGGANPPDDIDIHDFWVDFGQKPDFTDSAVLAKFLPTVSKGFNGSLPTGTASHFFFSGVGGTEATFHINDGTVGGLTLLGIPWTVASVQPT